MPTVNYGIAASSDDTSGGPGLGGFDPAVIIHGDASAFGLGLVYAGLRFNGVAVPQGATITSATLTVKQNSATPIFGTASSGTAWGTIKGVDLDDAPLWTTTNPQVTTKTTASVTITNSATVAYAVTGIVQEIVDRAGWVSGNDLAFATDPTGANGHMEWIDRLASSTDCAQLEIVYSAGGGSSYTLTADSGSFVLTGQAASLIGPVRPSVPQSYFRKFPRFKGGSPVWYNDASIITGPEFWDAASAGSYVLTADSGSFVLTGQPATLTYTPAAGSYTLTADAGSFALSGQSAGLRASRRLTAAQGAFALTGIAAVLRASRKLVSAVGSFALTGQAAGLKASRKITAAQGSFSLAGQSVNLRVSRKIGAGQGSFSLSGQSAGLKVSRTLSLDAGAFVLTGQDAGLVYTPAANSYTLTADAGSFSLSGQTAGLRAFRKLTAARGTFSLTGQDASLTVVQSPIVAIENRLFAPRIKRALRSPEVSRRLDAPGISRRHFSAEIARSLQAPAIKRKLYS